ncbi:hypothetical protein F4803DRAFT_553387 [Xylaria telfairii]|nr:hypothetical protein F4803DRAFT_553387 [Xylaria telfairii]
MPYARALRIQSMGVGIESAVDANVTNYRTIGYTNDSRDGLTRLFPAWVRLAPLGLHGRPGCEVNAWLQMSNTGKSINAPNTSADEPDKPVRAEKQVSVGVQTQDDNQALPELRRVESQKREVLLAEFNRRVNNLITETQTMRAVVRNALSYRSRLSMTARTRVAKRVIRDGGNNLVRGLNDMQQHLTNLLRHLPEPPKDLHVAVADQDPHQSSSPLAVLQTLQKKAQACVVKIRDGFETAEENVKSLAADVLPWLAGLRDKIIADISDMSGVEHEVADLPTFDSHDAVMQFARDQLNMIPISEVEAYASNQLGMLSTNEALEFAIESGFEPPADFDHDV